MHLFQVMNNAEKVPLDVYFLFIFSAKLFLFFLSMLPVKKATWRFLI